MLHALLFASTTTLLSSAHVGNVFRKRQAMQGENSRLHLTRSASNPIETSTVEQKHAHII